MNTNTLAPDLLHRIDAYWRAANYLSVGQIYLYDNPLLRRPLALADVKRMLLGHWGTTPGQNFIYVHLNRVIKKYDLDMIYVSGPGHGGPAVVANTYLEGTYSEIYPDISQDEAGLQKLFRQFSFPGGIPSHASPECPGSIHEGGELGYSLSHAFGAVFDNPELVVACVVGDGEAETGPLATAWHSNKFLDPATDGAVLPILHLNGYKIANPTVLARIEPRGAGAAAARLRLDAVLRRGPRARADARGHGQRRSMRRWSRSERIQHDARVRGNTDAPALADDRARLAQGLDRAEGGRRRADRGHVPRPPGAAPRIRRASRASRAARGLAAQLPAGGAVRRARPPEPGARRARAQGRPAHGRESPRQRRHPAARPAHAGLPRLRGRRADARGRGHRRHPRARALPARRGEAQRRAAQLPRLRPRRDALQRPRGAVRGDRAPVGRRDRTERRVPRARTAGCMEMLSEHQCEGWLEGYLLTGRHGLFNCYEAFIHIVDSMFNQHAKWLKVTAQLPWRRKIASLNYLLASHVWRQDHNGFTHQDPGFIDHVVNKKAEVVRVYLPPDANCLLSVMDHCLRSRHYVNVVIAGKHPAPQWLTMDAAVEHCAAGIGIWQWASNDQGVAPDVVMACCGDVPTLETLAAVSILREHLPELKIRVVNVVDLMKLQPQASTRTG